MAVDNLQLGMIVANVLILIFGGLFIGHLDGYKSLYHGDYFFSVLAFISAILGLLAVFTANRQILVCHAWGILICLIILIVLFIVWLVAVLANTAFGIWTLINFILLVLLFGWEWGNAKAFSSKTNGDAVGDIL